MRLTWKKNRPASREPAGRDRPDWTDECRFPSRGLAFREPNAVPSNHPRMSAFHLGRLVSRFQADAFNLGWLSSRTDIDISRLRIRINRMFDEGLIAPVLFPALQTRGWGMYYWFVKLADGTPDAAKGLLSERFRRSGSMACGFETEGRVDFFNGTCARTIDHLFQSFIEPWAEEAEVEVIHVAPLSRDIREDGMNLWDAPAEQYREFFQEHRERLRLAEIQDRLDATDIEIVYAINQKRAIEDFFDFDLLSEKSIVFPNGMREGFEGLIVSERVLVPLVYLNWPRLGLSQRMFIVRLHHETTSLRKNRIADELASVHGFGSVWEFTESFFDLGLWACEQTAEIEELSKKIRSFTEVASVDECRVIGQYRRWMDRAEKGARDCFEKTLQKEFLVDLSPKSKSRRNPENSQNADRSPVKVKNLSTAEELRK